MPTPVNRQPVRVARGLYSDLNTAVADLYEGEILYATDNEQIYIKESGSVKTTRSSRLTNSTAPATATSAGEAGDIRYSAGHLYICVATNTWVRAALSTF